jgi:hypothetical protein
VRSREELVGEILQKTMAVLQLSDCTTAQARHRMISAGGWIVAGQAMRDAWSVQ